MSFIGVRTADGSPHEISQFSRDTVNFQNNVTNNLDFYLKEKRIRTSTNPAIELFFSQGNEWHLYCVCEDFSSYGHLLTQVGLHRQTRAREKKDKDYEYLWQRVPYINHPANDAYESKSFPNQRRDFPSGATIPSTPASKYRYADVTISIDGVTFVPEVRCEANPYVARVFGDACDPNAQNLLLTDPPDALDAYAELAAQVVKCWNQEAALA